MQVNDYQYANLKDQINELDKVVSEIVHSKFTPEQTKTAGDFSLDYTTMEKIVKGLSEKTQYDLKIDLESAGCFRAIADLVKTYLNTCDEVEHTIAETKIKQNELNEVEYELAKYIQNEWTRDARKIDIDRLESKKKSLESEIRMQARHAAIKVNTAKQIVKTLEPYKNFLTYDLPALIEAKESEYWVEQLAVQIAIDTLTKQQLSPPTVERLLKMPTTDYNAAILKSMLLIENAQASLNRAKWLKTVIHETGIIPTTTNTPELPPATTYNPAALSDNNPKVKEALKAVSKGSGTVTINMSKE